MKRLLQALTPGNDLDELDRRAAIRDAKDDPEPAYRAMVSWIEALQEARRLRLVSQLRAWLGPEESVWHQTAAVEIAVRLRDESLMAAAADEARRRPTGQESHFFQLYLVYGVMRFPTLAGKALLDEWRERMGAPSSHEERVIAIRSEVVHCVVERLGPACVRNALEEARRSNDSGALHSVAALVWAVARDPEHAMLGLQLTDAERRLVIADVPLRAT